MSTNSQTLNALDWTPMGLTPCLIEKRGGSDLRYLLTAPDGDKPIRGATGHILNDDRPLQNLTSEALMVWVRAETGATNVSVSPQGSGSNYLHVERESGDGPEAKRVSMATARTCRTLENIGDSIIEFGGPDLLWGTGHPLMPGDSYTFDAAGQFSGDIWVVGDGSAAWATSTVGF